MSAAKQPHTLRPKLSAEQQTEMIVNEMLLLHLFPHHEQAEEFRRNVEYARVKLPALHAEAEIIVRHKTAEDGRLRTHPDECQRCAGSGTYSYLGRMRFCGCPAGEVAMKTQVLPDPPVRLAVAPKPMPAKKQLEQLRSLFEGEP